MSFGSAPRMTHDLRTLLNVILGNAQLLQESSPLTASQQKFAARIVEASKQMTALLGDRTANSEKP